MKANLDDENLTAIYSHCKIDEIFVPVENYCSCMYTYGVYHFNTKGIP